MGKEGSEHRPATYKRPSLDGALIADSFEVLADFYQLRNSAEYDELTECLVGLSCRDQEDDDVVDELASSGDLGLSQRRAEGYKLAKALQRHAAGALEALDAIDDALTQFDATVQFHPPLLEAIFDVETGDPRNHVVPEKIAILLTFFRDADWEQVANALGRMNEMPIREKLARGPVRNETLRRAVAACRTYWRDTEGHSWSMSSLKIKNVRDLNDPRNLQGRCEAFVSDIVNLCGITHGLHDLSSAWSAVDKS